jgi:branched-chain amino acid transport system permease protein
VQAEHNILYLEPGMMAPVLLYGFAAALLGGIDNPAGAVAGGFMVDCCLS